jgi:uncharacterized protein (DUF2236 family)
MRARPAAVPGAGTVGWKLQREVVLLLAWGPAILLQLAHPLVARGVADHSAFHGERWGRIRRLHRTLHAMLRLSFGTESEALAVVARINGIHDRVHGRLPAAAGAFPAGTAYSAHDPALLAWVHATLLEMNLRVYELFVADLTPDAKDHYCAEATAIGPHLGIPDHLLPRRFGELRRYMDAMLASDEIAVTDVARDLARELLCPPAPRVAAPALWLMRLPTLGLLPPGIREAYGFAWRRRDQIMLRALARLVRALLPLTPSVVRHWPAARAAERATRRASG